MRAGPRPDGRFVVKGEHRVRVRLSYLASGTPYKWVGECACGWMCVSWQWVAVDRPGGALPMALVHVGLAPAESGGVRSAESLEWGGR